MSSERMHGVDLDSSHKSHFLLGVSELHAQDRRQSSGRRSQDGVGGGSSSVVGSQRASDSELRSCIERQESARERETQAHKSKQARIDQTEISQSISQSIDVHHTISRILSILSLDPLSGLIDKTTHPNHKKKNPRVTSTVEWPGMLLGLPFSSNRPIRGPRITAPTNAPVPPTMCTTPEPAKSFVRSLIGRLDDRRHVRHSDRPTDRASERARERDTRDVRCTRDKRRAILGRSRPNEWPLDRSILSRARRTACTQSLWFARPSLH